MSARSITASIAQMQLPAQNAKMDSDFLLSHIDVLSILRTVEFHLQLNQTTSVCKDRFTHVPLVSKGSSQALMENARDVMMNVEHVVIMKPALLVMVTLFSQKEGVIILKSPDASKQTGKMELNVKNVLHDSLYLQIRNLVLIVHQLVKDAMNVMDHS